MLFLKFQTVYCIDASLCAVVFVCAGRQFHKCSKFEGGCNFFLWADNSFTGPSNESWSRPSSSHHTHPSRAQHPSQSPHSAQSWPPSSQGTSFTCKCGSIAVQRTVNKDGPNKGRAFYTCPKPREEQCGYFEWSDDGAMMSARGRGRGRGRGQARGGWSQQDMGDGDRKQRLCSVCRQPGHTKRNCPQLNF